MGKRGDDYRRLVSVRAARLRREGSTNNEIALLLDIPKDKVTSRVNLGERILTTMENEDDKGKISNSTGSN